MESRLQSCSLLFMVTCTCLIQTSITETTSSHVVAALRSTSLASEPEGARNGDQALEVSGWDASLWGPQPDASHAAAVLLRQFSGGKNYLTLEQFQSLLLCLSAGMGCPARDNTAFLALSNCTSNSALPHAQCQAFNKCLSQSEVEELFGSTGSDDVLHVTGLETLLPAVVAQIRQCYASSAAVRTRVQDQDWLYANRGVDEASVNVTDAVTTSEPGKKKPSQGEVWGYGMLFVTLISVCSLVGVSVLPLMARAMYQQMMTGLIGLAVGSLAASAAFHLLPQAYKLAECSKLRNDGDPHGSHDYLFMSLYFLVGLWAFFMIERLIKLCIMRHSKPAAGHSHAAVEYHPGESSVIRTVAWMIIFGDGFHNFLDGVSIGAAFSVSKMTGISVSLAVMCEELPHELGDFAVLLNAGMSMKQALMYNFLSATTCYAGLVLGILLGEFTNDNSYIFALAAGMFIYISCVDMVPELNEVMNTACEKGSSRDVAWIMLLQNLGLMLGAGSLFVLAYFQDQIALD